MKDMGDQQYEYIGFWPRVGAAIIETILMFTICAPLVTFFY